MVAQVRYSIGLVYRIADFCGRRLLDSARHTRTHRRGFVVDNWLVDDVQFEWDVDGLPVQQADAEADLFIYISETAHGLRTWHSSRLDLWSWCVQ